MCFPKQFSIPAAAAAESFLYDEGWSSFSINLFPVLVCSITAVPVMAVNVSKYIVKCSVVQFLKGGSFWHSNLDCHYLLITVGSIFLYELFLEFFLVSARNNVNKMIVPSIYLNYYLLIAFHIVHQCSRSLFIITPCLLTVPGCSAVLGLSCMGKHCVNVWKNKRYNNYFGPDGQVHRAKLYSASELFSIYYHGVADVHFINKNS